MTTVPAESSTTDAFVRSEAAAFATVSRTGYFGEGATDSNSTGNPRIVLGETYGQTPHAASLGSLGLSSEAVREQLQNCAGRYAGKTVIVTGGGRGIGEGCIRVFFEASANVVIADRDEATGSALAAELNARGVPNAALFVATDVSVVAQLQRLVDEAVARFGRLDCVVDAGTRRTRRSTSSQSTTCRT